MLYKDTLRLMCPFGTYMGPRVQTVRGAIMIPGFWTFNHRQTVVLR